MEPKESNDPHAKLLSAWALFSKYCPNCWTRMTFVPNVAYDIYIIYLLANFHFVRSRGWWWRFYLQATSFSLWGDFMQFFFFFFFFYRKAYHPHFCGDQNRYFKPNNDAFPTLTKWFLCLNLSRALVPPIFMLIVGWWSLVAVETITAANEGVMWCNIKIKYTEGNR